MIGRLPPTLVVVAFLESFSLVSWPSRPKATDPMRAVVRKSRRDQVMNASGKMVGASERIARARLRALLGLSRTERLHGGDGPGLPSQTLDASGNGHYAFALVGAEAQQGCDIADLVELRFIFYVQQFDIADDGIANDRVANVFDFAGGMSTRGTVADQVRIEMSTTRALYGARLVIVAKEQSLHFA